MNNSGRGELRKIKLKTRHKLNSAFVGEYHSAFRGNGLVFDNIREYQYGDDIRNVDWNVAARFNHLYVKEFIEERELNVVLLVDVSGSLDFGSVRGKNDVALEVVTLFLYLAQMNNDSISVALFTDQVERLIRPKKGRKFILSVLNEINEYKPRSRKTNVGAALDFLARILKKRSVVIVISDFLTEDWELHYRRLARKHDIIPVKISDPNEKPKRLWGLVDFLDLESGEVFLADTIPGLSENDEKMKVDFLELSTAEPIEKNILKYLKKKNHQQYRRV